MPPDVIAPAPERFSLGERIDALANAVRGLHHQERRGDLASLRRMDAGNPVEPAFQRILVRVAADASIEEARRIALLVKILAFAMSIDVLNDGRISLGESMTKPGVDVKERRVQMLMTARGPALDDLIVRIARRLARAGALPFADIGRLILGGPDTIERTRFKIAKAYWGAAARRDDAANDQSPEHGTLAGDTE